MSKITEMPPIHPACRMTPSMTEAEYASLLESLRVGPLLERIQMYRGQIISGRHRAEALWELGLLAPHHFEEVTDLRGLTVEEYVTIGRRCRAHHTKGQISMFVSRIFEKHPQRFSVAAKAAGVSPAMISKALGVLGADQALAVKVESGEISLAQAYDSLPAKKTTLRTPSPRSKAGKATAKKKSAAKAKAKTATKTKTNTSNTTADEPDIVEAAAPSGLAERLHDLQMAMELTQKAHRHLTAAGREEAKSPSKELQTCRLLSQKLHSAIADYMTALRASPGRTN